jgi:predicted enzyme related to lactoylglutathione lyase
MIKHIAFVAYPCENVARTRAWYETILGLTFAGPYKEDGIEKYNEAHLGDGCFSLIWSGWVERPAGSAASVAFEVDDLERVVRSLREAGAVVDNPFDGPVCKQMTVHDPEGNAIVLHEKKPSRSS